jgi:hypothetical protein
VAKRRPSRYLPGERGWIKTKNRKYWRYEVEREALSGFAASGSPRNGVTRRCVCGLFVACPDARQPLYRDNDRGPFLGAESRVGDDVEACSVSVGQS